MKVKQLIKALKKARVLKDEEVVVLYEVMGTGECQYYPIHGVAAKNGTIYLTLDPQRHAEIEAAAKAYDRRIIDAINEQMAKEGAP